MQGTELGTEQLEREALVVSVPAERQLAIKLSALPQDCLWSI